MNLLFVLATIEELLDHVPTPPDRNCSCHISPPCNDCVEHSRLRALLKDASQAKNYLKTLLLIDP